MTDINETVAEVLRLDAQATRGPWDYWFEVGTRLGPDREHPIALVKQMRRARCPGGVRGAGVDADAALISHYRTAAPALAREVQRLQGDVERLCVLVDYLREEEEPYERDRLQAEVQRLQGEVRQAQTGHDCTLVAAYESGLRAGQEAMRERCAAACDHLRQHVNPQACTCTTSRHHSPYCEGWQDALDHGEIAIRALEVEP